MATSDGTTIVTAAGPEGHMMAFDVATGEHYWISGPRKDGADALYATNVATEIDEDAREEYWFVIRENPALKSRTVHECSLAASAS